MFLKHKDFFDKPQEDAGKIKKEDAPRAKEEKDFCFHDEKLANYLKILESYCRESTRKDLLEQIESVREYMSSQKFTVAIVGEFNRGKSTLINRLLGAEVVPVSDLPTTVCAVEITGSEQDYMLWSDNGKENKYFLDENGWEAIKQKKEKNPQSLEAVYVKKNCPLLLNNDLKFIDTPGVNSQIDGDITMAERALCECDCAVLAMAAVTSFSETENIFLRERILTKKVPRIMVVLTKLDLVNEKERERVIKYVKNRLDSLGTDIPLYLSAEGMASGWEASSGPEAIKNQILAWLHESDHMLRKEERAYLMVQDIALDMEMIYTSQLEILMEKEEEKKKAVQKKKRQFLQGSQVEWDKLEVEMLNRCNRNFSWIDEMVRERQQDVIEKLQIELSHVGNPKEWWEKDYPYRIKMEMISLGNTLESNLQNFYVRDVNWLNQHIRENYGEAVPPQNQRIADKDIFRSPNSPENIELEDMKRTRIISRIGTGVATAAGYMVFGMLGLSPVGMAIGIGGGIASEIFMNKRVDVQKEKLSQLISNELPGVLGTCVETVEKNIQKIYVDTIHTMRDASSKWIKMKCNAIESAEKISDIPQEEKKLREKLDTIQQMKGR